MSIVDEKKKIFGQLAALRTLSDGMPNLNITASIDSITNKQDGISFLIDILKSLIGIDELRDTLVNTLTYNLAPMELELKKALKLELKGLVNCGVDPSIPPQLKNTGAGFDIELKKLDFLDVMHVDPSSLEGSLIYDDVSSGLFSMDFNTFLSNVIQDANNPHEWSPNTSVTTNPILRVQFNPNGPINNRLNIRASTYYSTTSNKKTLTDLNNDFIDSVKLFSIDKILTSLIDSVMGTLSSTVGKSLKQLEIEAQIDTIVSKMMSTQSTDTIDNSFFSFTNEEIFEQEQKASNRKRGIVKIINSTDNDVSLPFNTLRTGINDITTAASGTLNDQKIVVNKTINTFGDTISQNLNNEDKYAAKLNFIESLLRKIVQVIVSQVLSPKLVLIFTLNLMIVNTGTVVSSSVVDFMEKNKILIKNIINEIRDIIIQILMARAVKAITELVSSQFLETQAEKLRGIKAQLLSLAGVPQDVIRNIQKLGNDNVVKLNDKLG